MSDVMDRPTGTGPATAGSRPKKNWPLAIVLLAALGAMVAGLLMVSNYHTNRYQDGFGHGYNAGACQAKQDAIKQGYKSYLKVNKLGFTPSFTDGNNCEQVIVVLTKKVTSNGHTVETTCERAEIQLADANHVTPYTRGVTCTTVDTSTNEVSVGQAVGGG
jgi:hypothetical protein